ncbi:MAG: AAA family ATPase [Deltaproteobacteria bacterium]|nr:AAA family ATPase [Deltaproteobacteria bacterium]
MKERQGNLTKIGMPRLLHLIYRKGDAMSSLDIVREPIKKRFIFKDGVCAAASSNILNEVLGRLLMQEGIITQKDYERSLEVVLKEKKKHGQVLIAMGLITPEQLDAFLTLQIKRRVFKIFGWNEGTYRYVRSTDTAPDLPPLALHPAALILEGISLGFYPASRLRADLKEYFDHPVFAAGDPGKYALDDFNLNLQEKRFLESIDGRKTLREVLDSSDLLRHRALSLALSFIITGVIKSTVEVVEEEFFEEETRGPEAAEAPLDKKLNAEILFMKARGALEKKDYAGAVKTLTDITDLNPMEGEYWAYLGWAVYLENTANLKKAERVIKDAIDLNNDLDIAWHFLGMLSLASGDTEMARSAFRTAVHKNPWMLGSVAELKRLELFDSTEAGADQEDRKAYIDAFGFAEDPFTPVPGHARAYLAGSRHDALESLVRAVKKRSGPVLLTGPAGAGKTTLALELLWRLSNEKVLPAVVLKPSDRELVLIKEINAELGVSSETDSIKEQLLALGMRVSQNKIQGGHTLLIIDRAHGLTDGCLKLVQYFSRLKTLQIVLLGEPSLGDRLKAADFRELDQKIATRVQLYSLSMDETKEYFLKRLTGVRSTRKASCSITDEALVLLFEESGGTPSEINSRGVRLLSEAARYGTCEVDNIIAMAAFGRKSIFEDESAADVFVEEAFERAEGPVAPEQVSPEEVAKAPEPPVEAPVETGPASTEAPVKTPSETPPPAHSEAQTGRAGARAPAALPHPVPEVKEVRKAGTSRLLLILLMIAAAGLVAAFFTRALRFGGESTPTTSVAPRPQKAVKEPPAQPTVSGSGPVETSAAIQGSVEGLPGAAANPEVRP